MIRYKLKKIKKGKNCDHVSAGRQWWPEGTIQGSDNVNKAYRDLEQYNARSNNKCGCVVEIIEVKD